MTYSTCLQKSSKNLSNTARRMLLIGVALLALIAAPAWAEENSSPCQGSLDALSTAYANDPATRVAFQLTYDGLKPLPAGYTYDGSSENPWGKPNNNDGADLVASSRARRSIGWNQERCRWCR